MTFRVLVAAAALAVSGMVQAQEQWPAKPIRLMVPFPASGTIDLVARAVGDRLREAFGQPVVVENRPGANGNIGADLVAKAPADGYTLLMGTNSTHTINPALYPKMPYDALRDFVPIANVATAPNVVVVHPSVAAATLKEFIALARAQPGKIDYASGGSGSSGHLATELLKSVAGIDIVHVPYKGGPAAITDTLAGRTAIVFFPPPALLQHIKAGKLRPIAVTGPTRSPLLPDVPTVAESGYPGFEAVAWYGLFAPAGTPAAIVSRVASEVITMLGRADMKEQLIALGTEPAPIREAAFTKFLEADTVKWARVVKASGAKVD